MEPLKIDLPVIKEFLGGTSNIKTTIISPVKGSRYYGRSTKPYDGILILTPMLKEGDKLLNELLSAQQMSGNPLEATEHKRGKNYVYTFKPTNTVVQEKHE